jgi:hypothetical protein
MLRLLKIRFKAFKPFKTFKQFFQEVNRDFLIDRVSIGKSGRDRAAPTLIEIAHRRQDGMTGNQACNPP